MRLRKLAQAALLAAVVALMPAARADALSCAPPEQPASKYVDVVFDGVLLSGPREEPLGRLASPARMHVTRYLKGRGPRVVELGTDVPLLVHGDHGASYSLIPGLFEPYPGDAYRVYGDTPKRAGSSAGRGVLTPLACGATFQRRLGSQMRVVRGSAVAERDAEGRRWKAELLRGSGRLRCVRVHPGEAEDALECGRPRRSTDLLAAVVPAPGKDWTTSVAVVGADLRSIVVDGPGGRRDVAARGSGRLALAVLPGYAERPDLTLTARLADGREVSVPGFGGGLIVPSPVAGSNPWGFALVAAHPAMAGAACVRYAMRPNTGPDAFLFGAPRHGECGPQAEGFFATRYAFDYDEQARQDRRWSTIVLGRAPDGVARVTIAGPGGERQDARSGPGGQFAAMYPAGVGHEDLTVTFHGADGSERSFTGRRDWNTFRLPRSPLDRGE
jgi:hypothetical protein